MTKPRPYRARTSVLPELYESWLRTGSPHYLPFLESERVRELWDEYGASIIEEFIQHAPGTRPPAFWRYGPPGEHKPIRVRSENKFAYLLKNGLLAPGEEERARARRPRPAVSSLDELIAARTLS